MVLIWRIGEFCTQFTKFKIAKNCSIALCLYDRVSVVAKFKTRKYLQKTDSLNLNLTNFPDIRYTTLRLVIMILKKNVLDITLLYSVSLLSSTCKGVSPFLVVASALLCFPPTRYLTISKWPFLMRSRRIRHAYCGHQHHVKIWSLNI